MAEFERGTVRANELNFEYLTMGDGPLALCVHGFPDSPYSYRYLLPALADAGYRAVAPFNRGFAPTELPGDRHHVHSSAMVTDQNALHEALGGGDDAISWPTTGVRSGPGARRGRHRTGGDAVSSSISPRSRSLGRTSPPTIRSSARSISGTSRCSTWPPT